MKSKSIKCAVAAGAAFFIGNRLGELIRLLGAAKGRINNYAVLSFSLNMQDLLIGLGVAALAVLAVLSQKKRNMRDGIEHGSARWGTYADIAPYIDPDPDNNLLLTETERLTMNGRPPDPKLARNKNIQVVGGSGSGKTRFVIKPQILQMYGSYVITDPKGLV